MEKIMRPMGLRKLQSLQVGEKVICQMQFKDNKKPFEPHDVVVEINNEEMLVFLLNKFKLVFFRKNFDTSGICTTQHTITKFYYPA